MRILAAIALALIALTPCKAQVAGSPNNKSAKGTFYVTVDDAATVSINGKNFYGAGIGESRSPETEIKTGDRVGVELRDDGGGRHFLMVFMSSDNQTLVDFRSNDFRVVPDLGVTDFGPEQFQKWTKYALCENHKAILPIKNYSDYPVWGDLSRCTLACAVRDGMFSHRPR